MAESSRHFHHTRNFARYIQRENLCLPQITENEFSPIECERVAKFIGKKRSPTLPTVYTYASKIRIIGSRKKKKKRGRGKNLLQLFSSRRALQNRRKSHMRSFSRFSSISRVDTELCRELFPPPTTHTHTHTPS